jgi:FtsP/CotA-like multicopper oxidase with cupredoxin domain
MRAMNNKYLLGQALQGATLALGSLLALAVQAAAPGITGGTTNPVFNLDAADMHTSQPNGKSVYTWGYGCSLAPSGYAPAAIRGANCPAAQLPGPTLIVNEGDVVTVNLTNNLPAAAGNTSILFPGFQVAPAVAVSSLALGSAGVGYTSIPTVTISGGGGAGAAATALIDTVAQVVTGFTLTNPGSGYTSVPNVTISGGGATTAATATAVVGASTNGLLTQEAPNAAACNAAIHPNCNTVTYTFKATSPGTHSYYSGTQGDLQVEMGLYGALIVLPKTIPANCNTSTTAPAVPAPNNLAAESASGETDFRLAAAAYDNASTCYDREYLFQFSEMDDNIHIQAEQQVLADQAKPAASRCASSTGCLVVATEPYAPGYFLVNGRSMPDDMDPNYVPQYPLQPYNGNPHMHPGELTLVRIIGQGRWQHPFHEHANHVRVLARDANLLLSAPTKPNDPTTAMPAGPLMFTTTTTPGMTMDGIFYWTGKGLNWDVYGHGLKDGQAVNTPYPSVCIPDANGYYTSAPTAPNYYEWCGDHNKALEKHPAGQVASGGPITLPDANIVTNGSWYGGSPYLGGEANIRAVGVTPIPPAGTIANSPTGEAGYAFMWHSHNEREITTDNVFPGGMMMMMLVDPRSYAIDETN